MSILKSTYMAKANKPAKKKAAKKKAAKKSAPKKKAGKITKVVPAIDTAKLPRKKKSDTLPLQAWERGDSVECAADESEK
jgi:hypothetical protein